MVNFNGSEIEFASVLFYIICLLVLAKKLICVLVQAACGTSNPMREAVSIGREFEIILVN